LAVYLSKRAIVFCQKCVLLFCKAYILTQSRRRVVQQQQLPAGPQRLALMRDALMPNSVYAVNVTSTQRTL